MIRIIKLWLAANKASKLAQNSRALNLMMQQYCSEFSGAGKLGLNKPAYPNFRGLITEVHKAELDNCYLTGLSKNQTDSHIALIKSVFNGVKL